METWPHKVWNPFVQLDWHYGLFLTPPSPILVPGQSLHASLGILYMPLKWLGEDKSNRKGRILADGMFVVSRGHECKYLILPHINIWWPVPGFNIYMPALIIGSSSKCEFAVGSVRGTDGPIAVSVLKLVGFNWSCQGFAVGKAELGTVAPTCVVANWGTVDIGFTWGDLVASLICGLFDALKAILESALMGVGGNLLAKTGLLKSQMNRLFKGMSIKGKPDANVGDEVREEVFGAILGAAYASLVGGRAGDKTGFNDVLNSNAVTGMLTGETVTNGNGFANHMGALVDGNAELLAL